MLQLVSIVHSTRLEVRISRAEISQATEGGLETESQLSLCFICVCPFVAAGMTSSIPRINASLSLLSFFLSFFFLPPFRYSFSLFPLPRQNSLITLVTPLESNWRVQRWRAIGKNLHVARRVSQTRVIS